MTFSPDRRFRLLAILLAIAGSGVVAISASRPARADAGEARQALSRSLALLARGNATGARGQAQAAAIADPQWGMAQAVLARTHLALGEGLAAEAALDRAIGAGFDARRTHQLRAHARLLQGDTAGAVAAAGRTPPRYRDYADRIRAVAFARQGDGVAALSILDALLARAPGDAAAWTELGRIRLRAGDVGGAITASARAVAAGPDLVDALQLRAELVRGQYGLIASLPWFEAALRRDPDAHDALIEYAATLGDAGRTNDMLAAVRRAMAARPGSPQGYYLQSVLAARAGAYDLARNTLQRTGGGLDGTPGVLLLGGALDIEDGAYAQAVTKLRELVARQPTNIAARKLLATALLRADDARDALEVLRPAAVRADADPHVLALVARGFERTGERDWAARFLDRAAIPSQGVSDAFATDGTLAALSAATARAPGDPAAAIPYVRALIEAGQPAGAVDAADRVARANPGAPAALLVLGDAQIAAGRAADAAATYRRAAAVRFDEPTLLRLVDALERGGQRDQAANALALFLAQNPASVAAQRIAAQWQLAARDYRQAIATLEDLRFRLGDRDAALLAELALAYADGGGADRAVAYGAAGYALAPANPAVADAYGWALYRAGNIEAAAVLVSKAVGIAPSHAGLRWHLAQILADRGDNMRAAEQARAALRDPRFADRRQAQALVAALTRG